MSKGPMTITAAIVAAALAGCGGSSSNSSSGPSLSTFKSGFQAQKASFTAIGTDLQTAIANASSTSPSKIATEFSSLASRTTQAASALRALKPPAKYQTEVGQLAAGFDAISADMTAVSTAAKHNDPTAARTAAAKLVTDSATIHNADLKLTHELGLPVTGG
jgi:hypothetical protein